MDATEQVAKFSEFFESHYYKELLDTVAKGNRHLSIPFSSLAKFNIELAEDLLEDPENTLQAAKHTIEQMDLGNSAKGFEARFSDLPKTSHIEVRNIRSKHIGKLLQMEGIVRQKSDVRPQVTSARFECPSCGNIIPVLQLDQKFKEPHTCSCGRKGQFRLIHKELVDAQKIVLEEAPEDMDGGEQPKRLNIFLQNDLVSPISDKKTNPGSKVRLTGIMKEVPITLATGGKSIRFDLICECNHVEPVQEEFTNIVFTEEEIERIKDFSKQPDAFEQLATSLAPTIYGHDKVKEALLLQLFSGVQKTNDDGVSRRGDIHILLIGDPGAGKCSRGDTKILLSDGTITTIASFAQHQGLSADTSTAPIIPCKLPSLGLNGASEQRFATRVWQRPADELLRLRLRSGKTLYVTKNHPLFFHEHGTIVAKPAEDFVSGEFLATPRSVMIEGELQLLDATPIRSFNNCGKTYTYPAVLDESFARLLGYWCGDGHLALSKTSAWLSFTNNDEDVLEDYRNVFTLLFGHEPTLRNAHQGKSAKEYYVTARSLYGRVRKDFPELCASSGHKTIPKAVLRSPNKVLAHFLKGLFECDAHVNVKKRQIEFSTISKELAELVQLSMLRFGIIACLKEKSKHATNTSQKRPVCVFEIIISGESYVRFSEHIGFHAKRKSSALRKAINKPHNTNIDVVPGTRDVLFLLRKHLRLKQSEMGVPRPTYAHYEQGNRSPSVATLRKIAAHLSKIAPHDFFVQSLAQFAQADIFWDEILSVAIVSHEGLVYDLEVPITHNYVANGVIIHNSQLVKRMSIVAPKSRFVSGKGASGAGLTASVVKDEFLKGWALEAGTLVLANKGIACIDEMDKMSDEDTSAMHEALEQQTVSISKANIQATLRCQTTVLAAANPKFGRFDPYELIAKQINLPEPLINRFDLIFPMKDLPNIEQDTRMASFILNLHRGGNEVKDASLLTTEFIRKYIAYAKQHVKPELTDDALEEIQKYYVQMRNQGGEGATSAVPISARQLEALVRLAEASAKSRLWPKVTKIDSQRAIGLLHHCLSQIGVDPETGKFDIDRITTGITARQRSDISIVKEVLNELENAIGKIIPEDDIIREAEIKGVAEQKVTEILTKLTRQGDLFAPKNGFYSKVR